jgi:hypothetical protein
MLAISMCMVMTCRLAMLWLTVWMALTWTSFSEQWVVVHFDDTAVAVDCLLALQSRLSAAFVAVPEHEEED